MIFSPIALFVYNRPIHTRKCIDSLINNKESKYSHLYIFFDYLKDNSTKKEKINWETVKKIIETKDWQNNFSKVTIIKQRNNLGLANSIKFGINYVFEKYKKIIVLEDDLILSPSFLNFMNNALFTFEYQNNIMHVGGYTPPIKISVKEKYYFLKFTSSWGWGTWKKTWNQYNDNSIDLLNQIILNNKQDEFNFKYYPFTQMLKENAENIINSWAINWYASVFTQNGLGVYPHKSLVQNIGFDGSGTHCNTENFYHIKSLYKENITLLNKTTINESKIARTAYENFYKKITHPNLFSRAKTKLKLLYKNARN